MLSILQLVHWLPKEYIEGPVPFVHLPQSGDPNCRVRCPQMKVLTQRWFLLSYCITVCCEEVDISKRDLF